MDSFSDKLKTVLSDPESMAKITEIAKGFAAREQKENAGNDENRDQEGKKAGVDPVMELVRSPAIAEALRLLGNGSRERVNLLLAMRPFVKDNKKEKLDKIISTMRTLDLITSTQKLL